LARIHGFVHVLRPHSRRTQQGATDPGERSAGPWTASAIRPALDTVCGASRLYPRPQGPTRVKDYTGKTALVGTAGSGNMQLTLRIREDAAVKGRRQS